MHWTFYSNPFGRRVHTYLLDSRVISELSLLMAKLIEQKHQVALKARPMIWHSTSLTFQKKSGTKNDDSRKCVQRRQAACFATYGSGAAAVGGIG